MRGCSDDECGAVWPTHANGRVSAPELRILTNRVGPPGPNPTHGSVTLSLELANEERVEANVLDVAGRLVKTLSTQSRRPGTYSLNWNGLDESGVRARAGLYFVRVRVAGASFAQRFVLLH